MMAYPIQPLDVKFHRFLKGLGYGVEVLENLLPINLGNADVILGFNGCLL